MFDNENEYHLNKFIIPNLISPFIPVPVHFLENNGGKNGMYIVQDYRSMEKKIKNHQKS